MRTIPRAERLRQLGWQLVSPHQVARTPAKYRRYLASAAAEFTAIKGVDVRWQNRLGERSRGGVSRPRAGR